LWCRCGFETTSRRLQDPYARDISDKRI